MGGLRGEALPMATVETFDSPTMRKRLSSRASRSRLRSPDSTYLSNTDRSACVVRRCWLAPGHRPGPPTIRVEGSAFNTRCNMRLNFRLWCPPLIDGAPSRRTVKALFYPGLSRAPEPPNTQRSKRPSKLLSISRQFNFMHCGLHRFKLRPGWYHTVLHVTPQRHQQAPRQGHDPDAAHAFAAAGEALVKP